MISTVEHSSRWLSERESGDARTVAAAAAGFGGCLLVTAWAVDDAVDAIPAFSGVTYGFQVTLLQRWILVLGPLLAVVAGLLLSRWWPALLLASGLLMVPGMAFREASDRELIDLRFACATVGYSLAVIGVLACANRLWWERHGLAAGLAALSCGGGLLSQALHWQVVMARWSDGRIVVGVLAVIGVFAQLGTVRWPLPRRRSAGSGRPGGGSAWSWRRCRYLVAAAGAMLLAVPASQLTAQGSTNITRMLGAATTTVDRQQHLRSVVVGSVVVVVVTALAAMCGIWSVGGLLTVTTVQVAVSVPISFGYLATLPRGGANVTVTCFCIIVGAVAGALAAASRFRAPLAAAFSVTVVIMLFIAEAATAGQPNLMADPRRGALPAQLLLGCLAAAATAVTGSTVGVLAGQGALPAVLGPLVLVATAGGRQMLDVLRLRQDVSSIKGTVDAFRTDLNVSAALLAVVALMVVGLGLAKHLAARMAERKHAAEIQRAAAAAERERLSRSIHDGVLQVLSLVQRSGSELGERGGELAALAGEQEAALRNLLSGGTPDLAGQHGDLGEALRAMASSRVEVNAPAEPVPLPGDILAEVTAAVGAALDNVARHAGVAARAWVLVEDEGGTVRVTVRDDGVGFALSRLEVAAATGRLGVAQSMRGRIADLGGTVAIVSSPGQGVEVEFTVPRKG